MAISSIGAGSGLPLDQLLDDLRKSENQALSAIQSRQIQAENRLSAYGKLKGALESLQTAAHTLNKPDTYGAMKTSVAGDTFTASATSTAIPGDYSIRVESMATNQTLVTTGVASRTEAVGDGGVITFTLNDGSTQTLDLSDSGTSLNDIVQAINNDSDLGFSATLVNDGNPDAPHRLLLTATNSGVQAGASSISVEGNSDLQDLLGFDSTNPDPQQTIVVQDGTNALVHINGITITHQTNIIEDAIEGVTLTLTSTSPDVDAMSIRSNDDVTSKAITEFVSAYNTLQTTIRTLSTYDIENQKSSPLTGDSLARRLQSDIRNALNVASSSDTIQAFSQLGITTDIDTGTLVIDDDKLSDTLKNNMPDVQALLTGPEGLGQRITNITDNFTRSGGLISITTDSITASLTDLKKQYAITLDRIDVKMENYRRQFSALDSMVAQMNSVSSYLTQQLTMLSNTGNDK